MLAPLVASLSFAVLVAAQIVGFDAEHNATSLSGVWSSGSGMVQTGEGFVNVKNKTFNPPPVAGISYSFTDDMFFEMVEFTFTSNPTKPACPTATILFQHGTYEFVQNGSLILTPFPEDGLVQTQSPCSAKSSTIQQFNATILISMWRIWIDPPTQAAHLHLFRFDGAPFNKMILRYTDPKPYMQVTETIMKQDPQPPRFVRRDAAPSGRFGATGAVFGAVSTVVLGLVTALL